MLALLVTSNATTQSLALFVSSCSSECLPVSARPPVVYCTQLAHDSRCERRHAYSVQRARNTIRVWKGSGRLTGACWFCTARSSVLFFGHSTMFAMLVASSCSRGWAPAYSHDYVMCMHAACGLSRASPPPMMSRMAWGKYG